MENLNQPTEPLLPEMETEPDVLFGDCEALDAGSLFRGMLPESVKFFDLPLLERLHRRHYHMIRLRGSFRLAKLLRDYRPQLLRSESCQSPNGRTSIERLMFSMGDDVYVVYDLPELLVYAPTPEAATEAVARLQPYRKPETRKPSFKLISIAGNHASTQLVTVAQSAPLNEDELRLHYGADFPHWEAEWIAKLRQRRSGVSILHGPPGCGKTSYMRSLTVRLIGSFEFYYIPVSAFDLLSTPSFVNFWLEQKIEGRGKRRLAILEDAEELLLPRDEGSRAKVSNLLNIGDGFLGEHLNLHLVVTTNVPIRQLDAALLRPGRLMGTREFGRLTRPQAEALAKAKGLPLPDQQDFSLAELYCGASTATALNRNRTIGFTA